MRKSFLSNAIFLIALGFSFQSQASSHTPSLCEAKNEILNLQNWFIEKIALDFDTQVVSKNDSLESLKQLRTLHDALRNNLPINMAQFDQIEILCKKADCN